MLCNRKIPRTNILVDYTWEVRIPRKIWEKVKERADQQDVTYSWVVRFCVFTALKKSNQKRFNEAVVEFHNRRNIGATKKESHHRFQMCLYGEDQSWLRIRAMEVKTSVTSLILTSLLMFLDDLEKFSQSTRTSVQQVIKVFRSCNTKCDFSSEIPLRFHQFLERFHWNSTNTPYW